MKGGKSRASCHSDTTSDSDARAMQEKEMGTFVELNTAPAHNIPKHDSII